MSLFLGVVLALGACTQPGGAAGGSSATGAPGPARTRSATKVTCPTLQWDPPARFRLSETHHELVPLNADVLGTTRSFTGPGRVSAQTISGAAVGELTESYGDLVVTGHRDVSGGLHSADVMHGSFQGVPVDLVTWRDSSMDPPCDVQALLIRGADQKSAKTLIAGLR